MVPAAMRAPPMPSTMELGTLVAFLLYLLYLVVPISTLFMSMSDLQAGRAALARIEELMREPLEDPGAGAQEDAARGDHDAGPGVLALELRDVSFAHAGREASGTLRDVDLAVPERARVAIVGPSGAGKSSLLALIERLYDADAGSVRVLGRDVRDWPLNELRAVLGHVEQEAPVMAGTLRSNVVYARPEATDDEIADALGRANLTDFVAGLPDGLATVVGDGGVTLSGGERQRLALARMLLKRPRILLLDEVTSQMDGRSERLLKEALDQVAQECTIVVVAHRLSTVRDADDIVVLEAGRVRAHGTHEELLDADELYVELATSQLLVPDQAAPVATVVSS